MEVINLIELVKMKNGIEVIIQNTTVTKNSEWFGGNGPYYIRIEGLFKEKGWKGFEPGHFVVPLYLEHGIGTWSVHCSEGDTYNFFRLSPSDKPGERGEFLHYCLSEKKVLEQIEKDFGKESSFYIWIKEKCPISYRG